MTTKAQHRKDLVKCAEQLSERASELGEYDIAFLLLSLVVLDEDGTTDEVADLIKNFQTRHDEQVALAKKIANRSNHRNDFDQLFGTSPESS